MAWFKKRKIYDERIINTQNKFYKEAYNVAMLICFISIVVKYSLYGIKLENVILELLVLFIPGVYYTIRTVCSGIYSDQVEIHDSASKFSMNTKSILIGLGIGTAFSLFFAIRSTVLYGNGNGFLIFMAVFFICMVIYVPVMFLLFAVPNYVATRASKKFSELDDEEK